MTYEGLGGTDFEIVSLQANNACKRMHPYTRILNEMNYNSMTIWQRDYSTAVIHKWFPSLMCSTFHTNFILQAKIDRLIKKKKINNLSWNIPIAKENNHQMLPTSLLKYNKKLTKGLMRKFRNIFPDIETRERTEKSTNCWVIPAALLSNKPKLLYDICSLLHIKFSLNFINYKNKNNLEVVAFNNNNKKMTSDTLNIIEKENLIQQLSFKIKSILVNVHDKIRSYSTTMLDLYCSEIFATNEKIPVFDIIFNNIILFTSKDCKSKNSFRKKIQAFCAKQKKSLRKKVDKDNICKKRETSYITLERKCQKREKTCEKKKIDCSKRGKQTCKEQKVVSCKRKKNSCNKDVRDCHKTRKVRSQENRCKQKKNDISKTKDLYRKQHCMEQEQTHKEKDLCKKEEKEEIKKPNRSEIKKIKLSKKKEKNDTSRTKEDLCTEQRRVQQEQISNKRQEIDLCKKKKNEKIEKSDCSKIEKIKPCEKKECPPVKKAPHCPENEKN